MTARPVVIDRLHGILCARPRLAALALGLLSATGFQPLGLWPLTLFAVGLFALLAAQTARPQQAFALGWLFGVAHFTFSNNWIADSFTHQTEMPAVLGWVAVPLLALYLAVYPALAATAARALARGGQGWAFALLFAGAWIVTEWLRSWAFTGYAWNPLGMVLLGPFDRPGLAALAPLMGTYALSGVAVLLGCALVLLARERNRLMGFAVALLLVTGMYLPPVAPREGALPVTIVHPALAQDAISDPRFYQANFIRLAELTPRLPEQGGERVVLWPESGMAFFLRDGYPQRYYERTIVAGGPAYARRLLGATAGADSVLLTGAVDLEIGLDDAGILRAVGARNAVTAVSSEGEILGSYAKAHLVPYGEYLPMRGILEPLGLSRLVAGTIDFWPGPGPQTIDLGQGYGEAGIQVCYEIVFSGQVIDSGNRPDFIFNPSSEAWFGAFAAPQFLAQSRMRAIEEGLPVLRATNSGISAVIDPRGVVREYLGPEEQGRIDAVVPPAVAPTLFARLGNILALGWALVFLAAGLVAMRRQAR